MIENNQKKKLKSLYLLYGEERYLLENSVKKIKKEFGELVLGINYIQLNEISTEQLKLPQMHESGIASVIEGKLNNKAS